ncbi:hypothetical protein KCP74_03650 [Salmonella enterica subsp. enterica]|nr:hypothetical protein KCP74_03650 [Salmonella enterica subsp. enterica]
MERALNASRLNRSEDMMALLPRRRRLFRRPLAQRAIKADLRQRFGNTAASMPLYLKPSSQRLHRGFSMSTASSA